MIFTYLGIVLFFITEWVRFIKERPSRTFQGHALSYEADRSRHPV